MELKESQTKLVAAIQENPEGVITAAIAFNKGAAEIAADVRKVPGTLQGVAAVTVQYALQGRNAAESRANIIAFAKTL